MPLQIKVQDLTKSNLNQETISDSEDDLKYNYDTDNDSFSNSESESDDEYISDNPAPSNLSDIKVHIPGITLFYGMTNSGKSVLMKQLLYQHAQKFHQIFVFQGCKTDDWKCLPSKNVFLIDNQTDNKLKIIIDGAQKLKQKYKQHTLLIVDDPFNGSANYHQSKIWEKISTMSRHALISVWMSVQNPGLIPPVLKGNLSGFFVTKLSESHLKKIYEYSAGFAKPIDFINYVNSNVALGKVFYNDVREAYDKNYQMVNVPNPTHKWVIKLLPGYP